jgi:cytidylate kinase
MIITIDGPAGSGKSSVARALAKRLSYDFLDTGAMYRAIGLEALRRSDQLESLSEHELVWIASQCRIEFDWSKSPPEVILNSQAVSHLLRAEGPTRAASIVAKIPGVRQILVKQQQAIGRSHARLVTEGRDQGTDVFPDAPVKFFLTASEDVRIDRRLNERRSRGELVTRDDIRSEIIGRDLRDSHREVGPLRPAPDAIIVDTSGLSLEQVVDTLLAHIRARNFVDS